MNHDMGRFHYEEKVILQLFSLSVKTTNVIRKKYS